IRIVEYRHEIVPTRSADSVTKRVRRSETNLCLQQTQSVTGDHQLHTSPRGNELLEQTNGVWSTRRAGDREDDRPVDARHQRLQPRSSSGRIRSARTKNSSVMLNIPFIMKNAASSLVRFPGCTSECS